VNQHGFKLTKMILLLISETTIKN